jgi:hypothetical protein
MSAAVFLHTVKRGEEWREGGERERAGGEGGGGGGEREDAGGPTLCKQRTKGSAPDGLQFEE